MPYTVNGIGTTYCGTWNRQVQDGVCEACHQRGKLVSYETWHCVCVLFIPIIPLGKKQILNYCPSCSRHRVMAYREWVKVRDKAIGETATELSSSPDDPDKAVEMHATLVAFQKQDEAIQLGELLEEKFADVSRVQFYLAAWYERTGKGSAANRLFLRAFELEPDTIHIRRAAVLTFIEEGHVDQAKSLTQPFLPGTDNFDAGVFYTLAAGFQKVGRHQDAVQTLRMLLDAAPGLKNDKTFRKTLAISEKALGVEQLTIPADPFYRTAGFMWLTGIAALLAATFLWNGYVAGNRNVTLVNGLNTPITVEIDGKAGVRVPGGGQTDITLAEGTHAATVAGAATPFPKVEFEMATNWWERFFRKPVFILDPTRSAAVLWEEATYVAKGTPGPDPRHELRLGEAFTSYKHVDYRFVDFPDTINLKKKSEPVTKTRISVLRDSVADLAQQGPFLGASAAAMLPFLETHLQEDPDQEDLLPIYTSFSIQSNKAAEGAAFLGKRLKDRPVRVGWHRMYQTILTQGLPRQEARDKHEQLKRDYGDMVEHEPNNASLQYLRGRLEGHCRHAMPYVDKALEIEPEHPYATYASGHIRLVSGDFEKALEQIQKAVDLRPSDVQLWPTLTMAKFAAGEFDEIEKVARADLQQTPLNPSAMENLLKVLVMSNRADEAEKELVNFTATFQRIVPGRSNILLQPLRLVLASIKGDFEAVEKEIADSQEQLSRKFAFIAKLETNQLADIPPETPTSDGAYWNLCRELVARKLGDAEQAMNSRNAALTLLDQGFDMDWVTADVLREAATVEWADIADLGCEPSRKAVVLVVMAHERPDLRSGLLELAEKLNYDLEFPHYLLAREIAELRQK